MSEDRVASLLHMLEHERLARRAAEQVVEARTEALHAAHAEIDRLNERAAAAPSAGVDEATLVTMSHELRTPMHTILGLTEDLVAQSMTAEQRGLLERVRANAVHLRDLLDDFLDLARIDSGTLTIGEEPFDPTEVLEAAVELAVPAAQRKRIELTAEIDPAMPISVAGDARRVGQIVSNLLGNAVKYTRRGDIRLRASIVYAQGRDMLEVAVEDTGVGIAKDDLPRVFERFVRVGNTAESTGTGLGLSLVRSLATRAGGDVHVVSTLGVGSTFTARIPVHVLDAPETERARGRYAGLTIAVVVRNDFARSAMARTFAYEGANVVSTARFGELDRGGGGSLDLLLIDVAVADFTQACRARAESSATPLLVVSAFEDDTVAAVKASQASGVIVRPMRRARLLARVDRVLGLSKKESQKPPAHIDLENDRRYVRPRALLVEDDPDNRQLLRRTFTRLGYVVTAVEDGEAGLARAKAFEYDVIVADVMMPRLGGPDMARAIRAHEADRGLRAVPIIAVTASAFESTKEECERAGMTAFMRKPVVSASLEQVLATHVDRRATVLCVDDSAESRKLISFFLDAQLVRVVPADGAMEAIERTQRQRIDVILMDLEMPGVGGFELAAELRASHEHVETPIIAVTAHDDLAIHRRCIAVGFTDILVKPVSRATLRKMVERYTPAPARLDRPGSEEARRAEIADEEVAYVEEDIIDLVPQFLESRRADVSRLRAALEAGDRATVRKIGHGMRGSGGGYGFHAVSRFGGELEDSAASGDDEAAERAVDALAAYLEKVRFEVRPA